MSHAAIIGAGIAGLVAARALQNKGWTVTIYERSPQPDPAGAGIILGTNAVACLDHLGLGAALRAVGHDVGVMCIATETKRMLQRVPINSMGERYHFYAFTRRDLHDVLADGLPVHYGAPATVEAGVVRVDGQVVPADLIVGADGIHSRVRAGISDVPLRYSGQTCWRTLGENVLGQQEVVEHWGPGMRVGVVPLRNNQLYTFIVANAPEGSPAQPTDRDELVRRFAPFGDLVPRVLSGARTFLHHDLRDLPQHVWGQGKTVLIGDAAHAMTPNMGQGAAMGVEDAVVLAEVAAEADPAAALAARRQARVQLIARRSFQLGQIAQWENGLARWVRDRSVQLTPASVNADQLRRILTGGPVSIQTSG